MAKGSLTEYCYPTEATTGWLEHIKKSHLDTNPLSSTRVENAVIIPDLLRCLMGGVFESDGKPIVSAFQRYGIMTANKLFGHYNPKTVKREKRKAIYLGQYRNHWGSFLVDSASRLWYTPENPQDYVYVFAATQIKLGGIHKNVYNFLSRLGINEEQVLLVKEPTVFDSLIIPEMSLVPYGTQGEEPRWHKEYLDTVYKITDSVLAENEDKEYPQKVYFSRGKFSKNQKSDFGEELIAEMMRANGYYVVYPEEHSLEEQILYVNKCKEFASVGGSCAHNVIFSKTAPKMTLFSRMNGYQWHQWMLDEMAGVEPITYVDSYSEPYKPFFKTTISGPYLFWPNKNVKKYALDRNFTVPKFSVAQKISIRARYTVRVIRTILSNIKRRIIK